MKLRLAQPILTCLLAAGFARAAWGQTTQVITGKDVQVGYQALPTRNPNGTDSGLQVSDGVLMHVGIGAEIGYDSNVFYAATPETSEGSALLRIVPFVELTNATRAGVIPSTVFFDLGANLTYREYLSSNPDIQAQRAFMPSAAATLNFGSTQALSFLLADTFGRIEDPPYLEDPNQPLMTPPYLRDSNLGMAQLSWSPGGGRLSTSLRYANTIDYFETASVAFANSMTHDLMLDVSWRWLPKTAIFLNADQQYVSYFHSDDGKATSYPLRVMAGLRGLITNKLSLTVAAGYSNGFYQTADTSTAGPHVVAGPSGIRGNLLALAEITYRPTIETTAVLGYRHDFQNAVIGDFYYVDAVYLNLSQAIAGRVGFGLSGRYESRSFQGVPTGPNPADSGSFASEHANYWQVGANLDYHIRGAFYTGVSYTLMKNDASEYALMDAATPPVPVLPSYTKQLVFARFGVTY